MGNNDNNKGTTILETVSWARVKPLQSITPLRAPNGPAYSRLSSIPVLTVELRKQKLREIEGTMSVTSGDMSPSLNHYNNLSSVLLHKHGLHLFLLQAPCWEVLENVWSFQPGAHLVPSPTGVASKVRLSLERLLRSETLGLVPGLPHCLPKGFQPQFSHLGL